MRKPENESGDAVSGLEARAIGPCLAQTVPCGCEEGCDWCAGTRWLTPKVKTVKEAAWPGTTDLEKMKDMLARMGARNIIHRTKTASNGNVWDTLFFADPEEHANTPTDALFVIARRYMEFCNSELASI